VKIILPNDELPDWRARWDAIYAFLDAWRGKPFRPAPANQRIAEIEFTLDATLPPSVREWVSFATAHDEIKDCFTWRDSLSIEKLDEHDAVSLLLQGEGDYYWAVRTAHLALPDPPVGTYYLDHDLHEPADPQRKHFVADGDCAQHVAHFAFHYLLSYFRGAGGGSSVDEASPAFDRVALTRDLGAPSQFGSVQAFATDEVLVWRTLPGLAVLGGNVHVELRHEKEVGKLPVSVQHLLEDAHIFKGDIARPQIYERRKRGRPWWRRPFG
jgi:hypothetical protein